MEGTKVMRKGDAKTGGKREGPGVPLYIGCIAESSKRIPP
jgi:hypothetical protein